MAVRLKDIARDLNVSIVTVSKVLRNHGDISEETRRRVLQRVKELNYRPNPAARALVTGRNCTMGLVVPDLVHPFFAEVAKGLSRALRKEGYSLLISSSEEDAELERQEIDQLLAGRVDALVVASAQGTIESLRRIEEQKMPYVLIDRQFTGLAANFVGVDDLAVGDLATSHLIEIGCRRIAHIRGPEVSTALGRLEGYRRALARHDVTPPEEYLAGGCSGDDTGVASGYEAMGKLLALRPAPDGIFCYNDPIALGAMKAILEAGLHIPGDVAVIGCGNIHYADLLRVPLSSVDQDSAAIGERAGQLALALIASKAPPQPETILLEPRVIVRSSTQRVGAAGTI
jgi:LacI family transcriptional regulator, galactose operon repressor